MPICIIEAGVRSGLWIARSASPIGTSGGGGTSCVPGTLSASYRGGPRRTRCAAATGARPSGRFGHGSSGLIGAVATQTAQLDGTARRIIVQVCPLFLTGTKPVDV